MVKNHKNDTFEENIKLYREHSIFAIKNSLRTHSYWLIVLHIVCGVRLMASQSIGLYILDFSEIVSKFFADWSDLSGTAGPTVSYKPEAWFQLFLWILTLLVWAPADLHKYGKLWKLFALL